MKDYRIRVAAAIVALGVGTAGLAACSSGSSAKSGATTVSASTAAAGSGTVVPGQRANMFANPKVQQCLKAAGITVPTGGNFPRRSGAVPSGSRPSGSGASGFPSGQRPSGAGAGAGGGFGGNTAEGKKIQAALKACGITLPTGGFRRPSVTPTASPTS